MLRKLFITAVLLVAFLPVNSWAIASQIKYDVFGTIHGGTHAYALGYLQGKWNEAKGELYDISGGLYGLPPTVGHFDGGHIYSNGSGYLHTGIYSFGFTGVKSFSGYIGFKDYGYHNGNAYNNYISENYIHLWGKGKLATYFTSYFNPDHSYYLGKKKVGLDIWGHGNKFEVPEPATMVLMGLGLMGMVATRRKKPSKLV